MSNYFCECRTNRYPLTAILKCQPINTDDPPSKIRQILDPHVEEMEKMLTEMNLDREKNITGSPPPYLLDYDLRRIRQEAIASVISRVLDEYQHILQLDPQLETKKNDLYYRILFSYSPNFIELETAGANK